MKSIVLFICLLSSTLAIRPHIISILQDDLGFYDSGIHNPTAKLWTRNITQLAETGVILNYHYSHWHCSPSRRSFITGRLPIHHGEQLSSNDSDDIDLRMTWISDKLTKQGTWASLIRKQQTNKIYFEIVFTQKVLTFVLLLLLLVYKVIKHIGSANITLDFVLWIIYLLLIILPNQRDLCKPAVTIPVLHIQHVGKDITQY